MFNKLALAAAVAIPLGVLSLSGSAMAGYSPNLHTPNAREPLRTNVAVSCADARRMIHENGYRNVMTRDCDAGTYVFRATRGNHHVVLHVNSRNGHMWRA